MRLLLILCTLWPVALVHAQRCGIAGQVFFADAVGHAITIKTDSGELVNFSYDSATKFLTGGSESQSNVTAARVQPEELNIGDRLCVGTSEPLVVTVTPRREIRAEQEKELARWQADSLYGVVAAVDRKARLITLDVSAGRKQTVEVSPDAAHWLFPPNTTRVSDAVAGSLDRVSVGDTLYVRGAQGSQKFVASLVVSGGFRSFAATIESIEAFDEVVHVRLVLSANRRTVHISQGELYAIGQVGGASADKTRRLYEISAADLQPGDTVLILGIAGDRDSLRAYALIAGFSASGVLPPDPSQKMRWIFDNVRLGDKP